MKQSIRTRLLLFFVCALMLLVSASALSIRSANTKAAVNETNVTNFVDRANALTQETYDDTLLTNASYVTKMRNAISAYNDLGTDDRADDRVTAVMTIYNSAYAVFEEPFALYDDIVTVVDLYNAGNIAFADKGLVDSTETTYKALISERPAVATYLGTTLAGPDYAAAIEAGDASADDDVYVQAYEASSKAIDDVTAFIDGMSTPIQYGSLADLNKADGLMSAVNAKDLTNGSLVVGDVNYTTKLAGYWSDYEAEIAKADAVKDLVDLTSDYCEDAGAEVTWTIREAIDNAYNAYNELDATANNNLQQYFQETYPDDYAKINTMYNRLDSIVKEGGVIDQVEAVITAIGTVEWTEASKNLIADAEAALEGLDNDIKVAGYTAITNYSTYTAAHDMYYVTLAGQIDKVIEDIDKIGDADDWKGALATAEESLAALTYPTQQRPDVTNLSELSVWTQKRANLQIALAEFRALVNAVGETATVTGGSVEAVVANQTCLNQIVAAETYYDEVMVAEDYAIYATSEHDLLVAMRDEFDRQADKINPWLNAMETLKTAIGNDVSSITYANWDKVNAAEVIYYALEEGDKEKAATFTDVKKLYDDAVAKRDELVKVITDLAQSMMDLVDDTKYNFADSESQVYVAYGSDAYISAVKAVETALANLEGATGGDVAIAYLEGLSEGTILDLEGQAITAYVGCKKDYDTAQVRVDALEIEKLINAISDPVTTDDLGKVGDARTAYDTYIKEGKDANYVRNYTTLTDAEGTLEEVILKLTTWVNKVNAFIPEGKQVSELVNIDVKALKALADEFATFSEVEQGYIGNSSVPDVNISVPETKTLLDSIVTQNNAVVEKLDNDINALPEILDDTYTSVVDALMIRYNALFAEQKTGITDFSNGVTAFDALQNAYSKLVLADNFENAVKNICAEINAGEKTLANYAVAQALKSIYASASAELKSLISQETTEALDAVIAAYDESEVGSSTIADIQTKLATLIATLGNAESGLVKDVNDLQTKLATLEGIVAGLPESTIKASYEAYVNAEIAKLTNEMNTGSIDVLEQKLDELIKVGGRIEKIEEDIATLEGIVAGLPESTIKASYEAYVNAEIAKVQSTLATALSTAVIDLNATDAALAEAISKVAAEIAKTIEDVTAKLEAADKAITDDYKAADADLQAQIDGLQTALIATSITLFVLVVALGVVVLILFKKKETK